LRSEVLTGKSQNERFIRTTSDHHNITGQFNPAVHGFDGINTVSLAGFPSPVDDRIIATTTELEEFPFNLDMNSGYQLGIGTQYKNNPSFVCLTPCLRLGTSHNQKWVKEQLGDVLSCSAIY
jgi:hypothetical protein